MSNILRTSKTVAKFDIWGKSLHNWKCEDPNYYAIINALKRLDKLYATGKVDYFSAEIGTWCHYVKGRHYATFTQNTKEVNNTFIVTYTLTFTVFTN